MSVVNMPAMPVPPKPETLKDLHADLTYWVGRGLAAKSNVHPDLKEWRRLLIEITSNPPEKFSFDQLQKLVNCTPAYDALAAQNKTNLDSLSVSDYARADFSQRIIRQFNNHPANEAYRMVRDFYIQHHEQFTDAVNYLFGRNQYKKAHDLQKSLQEFLEMVSSFDPRFAANAPYTADPLELAQYSPDITKVFTELANNKSVLHGSVLKRAYDAFDSYYHVDGDPLTFDKLDPPYTPPSARDLYLQFNNIENDWSSITRRLRQLAQSVGRTP